MGKHRQSISTRGLILLAVLVTAFVSGIIFASHELLINLIPNPTIRGTYGDMFGITNALFSGLAFAGIIITIVLQMRELGFQREELQQTREVFEEQNLNTTFQRHELKIQEYIENHIQYVNALNYYSVDENKELKGEEAIRHISKLVDFMLMKTEFGTIEEYNKKYKEFADNHSTAISIALSNVESAIYFLNSLSVRKDSKLPREDNIRISHFISDSFFQLRSNISREFLNIFCYYLFSDKSNLSFKPEILLSFENKISFIKYSKILRIFTESEPLGMPFSSINWHAQWISYRLIVLSSLSTIKQIQLWRELQRTYHNRAKQRQKLWGISEYLKNFRLSSGHLGSTVVISPKFISLLKPRDKQTIGVWTNGYFNDEPSWNVHEFLYKSSGFFHQIHNSLRKSEELVVLSTPPLFGFKLPKSLMVIRPDRLLTFISVRFCKWAIDLSDNWDTSNGINQFKSSSIQKGAYNAINQILFLIFEPKAFESINQNLSDSSRDSNNPDYHFMKDTTTIIAVNSDLVVEIDFADLLLTRSVKNGIVFFNARFPYTSTSETMLEFSYQFYERNSYELTKMNVNKRFSEFIAE